MYLLDVFGGNDFLTKATNSLGLRGYVFDTKFGPRYDVTQPIVLTRIRQEVSTAKCVAGTMSPTRPLSASAAIAKLASSFSHAVDSDSWLWDVPKIRTLAAQPRTSWTLAFFFLYFRFTVQKANATSG